MWYHSSDDLVEDTARGTEVEGTASSGIVSGDLAEVGMILDWRIIRSVGDWNPSWCRHTFCSEEFARDIERLTSDDHYLLTVQELLRDDAGKTTEQVTLAVNHNLGHC